MLGDGGHDPFNGTERDLAQLSIVIRGEVEKPLFVFGHSLGWLDTQRFIELHGSDVAGGDTIAWFDAHVPKT